jgi:hypothetical protein
MIKGDSKLKWHLGVEGKHVKEKFIQHLSELQRPMVKMASVVLVINTLGDLGLFLFDITSEKDPDKYVFTAATTLTNLLMMGVTFCAGISLFKFKKYSDIVCILCYMIVVGALVYQSYIFPIGNEENEPHLSAEYKKTRRDYRNTM